VEHFVDIRSYVVVIYLITLKSIHGADGVIQVVECLLSKHQTLSSNFSTAKNKKEKSIHDVFLNKKTKLQNSIFPMFPTKLDIHMYTFA
jgi:hypothetical protein